MAATNADVTFVTNAYQYILGRSASTSEINSWAVLITNGVFTDSQVSTLFSQSGEATQYVLPIVELYEAFYGRAPDAAGLAAWVSAYRGGMTYSAIATAFSSGTEFTSIYGSTPTAEAFISAVYQNILGRTPDAAGLAAWVATVGTNSTVLTTTQMASLVASFSGSAEAQSDYTPAIQAWLAAGSQGSYPTVISGITGTGTTFSVLANGTYNGTGKSDTFNAVDTTDTSTTPATPVAATLAGVTITGGAGVDTLNFTTASAITALNTAATSVTGVEQVNLTSTAAGVVADLSTWTGVKAVAVTGVGAITFTAPTSSSVSVTDTATGANAISVTGGSTIAVTAKASTGGVIGVTGDDTTTSVTVAQTGTAGAVTISDSGKGSLTSVSLTNSAAASSVTSTALASVTLGGTNAGLTLDTSVSALGLTLSDAGNSTVTVTDTSLTTVALHAAGTSAIDLTNTHATALTVDGTGSVTLTSGLSALTTATITGSAGLTADLSAATVTDVNATGTSGNNVITIDATKATFEGGSGNDTVIITAIPTKALTGGTGTDVLEVNVASDGTNDFSASTAYAKAAGFETLGLGGAATGTYYAAGFSHLTEGSLTGAVTFTNVAAGTDLTITASTGQSTTYQLANAAGTSDALTVNLTSDHTVIAANQVIAQGVESVTINATDTHSSTIGNFVDTVTLVDTSATSITVTGNTGVNLSVDATDTAVTSINAAALTSTAATTFQVSLGAALASAASIAGSATGVNNIDGSVATKALTITGGSQADVLKGGTVADTINGGGGNDTITGNGGADTINLSGSTTAGVTIIEAVAGDTGTGVTGTAATTVSTAAFDVVTGVASGLKLDLTTVAATTTVAADQGSLIGLDDQVVTARGSYNAGTHQFTYSASGSDTLVTYDTTAGAGTAFHSVVLVGAHLSAVTDAAGLVTLG